MAIFSSGGTSFPDFYLALLILSLCLISTILNPLVLLHNYRKHGRSLARLLFIGLASVDLLACLVLPLFVSVGLIAGKDVEECKDWDNSVEVCEDEYWQSVRMDPGPGARVLGVILWTLSLIPGHVTGFLAVTRYYQIKRPLAHVNKRVVVGLLLLSCCYPVFSLGVTFSEDTTAWFTVTQTVFSRTLDLFGLTLKDMSTYFFIILITVIIQIVAIVASLLTVLELARTMRAPLAANSRKNSKKGSVKILLTNLGSVVFLCSVLVKAYIINTQPSQLCLDGDPSRSPEYCDFFWGFLFSANNLIPAFISALNPVIYLSLTPRSRVKTIRGTQQSVVGNFTATTQI